MRRYHPEPLQASSTTFLDARQAQINGLPTFELQTVRARQLFSQKNNLAFADVRRVLDRAAPGDSPERGYCYYCEHDRQSAIEHIVPLAHFPDKSHQFENFVLACTTCNSFHKSDRFALFDVDGVVVEYSHNILNGSAPPLGDHVFINQRYEQPLDFIRLDLKSGVFIPKDNIGASDTARAIYTIDCIGLNKNSLPKRRLEYVDMYVARLRALKMATDAGEEDVARRIVRTMKEALHPTVLIELRRQKDLFDGLADLIEALPANVGAP